MVHSPPFHAFNGKTGKLMVRPFFQPNLLNLSFPVSSLSSCNPADAIVYGAEQGRFFAKADKDKTVK
jgi:hypothetical protein